MKYRLLAPGPTPIPDRVLLSMAHGIIHHRTREFEEVFASCQEGLAWLLNTEEPPLIITSSGTGSFEAAIQNFFQKEDKILCVTGGKFGDNWLKMSRAFGLNAIEIPVEWGQAILPEQMERVFLQHKDARGLIIVASETSTGVLHPYEEISKISNKPDDCLVIVDGVTAVGVFDVDPLRNAIDVLLFGSQKGLMLPPGLSFLWANERAHFRQKSSNLGKYYFDINKEKKAQKDYQTAHTPAVSLIIGLREALKMMKEEGKEAIFSRHERLAKACRAAIEALNLKLFAQRPSPAITAVYMPSELEPDSVYQGLQKMANFTIAGGQEHVKGKIFRIGHMGYVDELDLISAFGALEMVLMQLGYEKFSPGDSLKASLPLLKDGLGI